MGVRSRFPVLSTWVLVVLMVGVGCARPEPAATPPSAPPNVVLVLVDTLGVRHLGCYREGLGTSPNIDALAADGVLFRRAMSTAPWTQPAVASLLTSRMPSDAGVQRLGDELPAAATTAAELLAGRGYATAAVVSHYLLAPLYGFDQGFGTYEVVADADRPVTSATVTDRALAWLDTREQRPFFLMVHYFDPHFAYIDHPEFDLVTGETSLGDEDVWSLRERRMSLSAAERAELVARYREEVAFTDAHVGRLLDGLAARGLDGDTAVVLVADHGEELLEHDWIGHTRFLYDTLLHVPLVLRLPGGPRGLEVAAPVSLLDVLPTVAELVGAEDPAAAGFAGESLLPLLEAEAPAASAERVLFGEVTFLPVSHDHDEKRTFKTSVLALPHKLIHDLQSDAYELYDVVRDPDELEDLAGRGLEVEQRLREHLDAWEDGQSLPTGPADLPLAEDLDRLRALGYIN